MITTDGSVDMDATYTAESVAAFMKAIDGLTSAPGFDPVEGIAGMLDGILVPKKWRWRS